MKLEEKYTIDKTKKGEENKEEISKEAYAVCEFLERLEVKLDKLRKMSMGLK
jgi:hypothetical protein